MVRIGVVGCGGIGMDHARQAQQAAGVELAGMADVDAGRLATATQALGVKGYASTAEMLAVASIEAVVLTVPTFAHSAVAQQALRAGKHVLVEKPPAASAAEVAEMIAIQQATGKILCFCYQRRHDPVHRQAKALIAQGALGTIYAARAGWINSHFNYQQPKQCFQWHTRGAAMGSLGGHYLDFVWWLMGSPDVKLVVANAHKELSRTIVAEDPGDDYMAVLLVCTNGATITVEASRRMHRERALWGEVYGTEGRYNESGEIFRQQRDWAQPALREVVGIPDDNMGGMHIRRQLEHFARAIRGEVAPEIAPAEAYRYQRILDAIYTSAETGQAVSLT